MPKPIPFNTLFHADWSTSAGGRSVASATRTDVGWRVTAPRPVGDTAEFCNGLFTVDGPVLAGFDFPIGLPEVYAERTALSDFPGALNVFGQGEWREFFRVAERPDEITPRRPFYPRTSAAGSTREDLLRGLGIKTWSEVLRRCEHATPSRRAASPIFWTLGGSQVGKAAIAGWSEIVQPAKARGARLWPFDGELASLATKGAVVLAETYPTEAYGHVGVSLRPGMSKRRQADRAMALEPILPWAAVRRISFDNGLLAQIKDGFGAPDTNDDLFDAFLGLLGMLEVVDGVRAEGPANLSREGKWEGWILGQEA
jgi:hypothetical protein